MSGEWRVESGERRVESGEWRVQGFGWFVLGVDLGWDGAARVWQVMG